MIIEKTPLNKEKFYSKTLYYEQARLGMHDVIKKMVETGLVENVYIPGYVGWSPKEGSGIFDSIVSVDNIKINYYRMTYDLEIDEDDLYERITGNKNLVLIVNYFGFRDKNISRILKKLKDSDVYIMEDNAHGFFTWHENKELDSDIIVFSLHKMFPFANGGCIIVKNPQISRMNLSGETYFHNGENPSNYRIHDISEMRIHNYKALYKELKYAEEAGYLESLKKIDDIKNNIPQTYPIRIKVGNRDSIYQIMNDAGFGVVSLYHTMIKPLQNNNNDEAIRLSKCIMNLPIHQDVDTSKYKEMVECLLCACEKTRGDIND